MIADYTSFDGVALAELMRRGEVHPSEVMETAIELAWRLNEQLNFIAVDCREIGRAAAREPLPESRLAGVPYLLKDAFTSWKGTVTTSGCKLFKDFVSPADSHTAKRTRDAGLLLFAKSTTPEWGWALAAETLLHGDTLNPWDLGRTPGGSSGGAAAAVAAGVVPFANASDGGGSIRVPAAYCGLVGFKASRGRISWGPALLDFGAGMGTEGCVSRTVRDTAAYLDIMHGQYPGEPYIPLSTPDSFEAVLSRPLRRLRIGLTTKSPSCVETYAAGVAGVHKLARICQDLGHEVGEMSLDGFDYLAAYSHVRGIYSIGHYGSYAAGREIKGAEPSGDDFMRFMCESARSGSQVTGVEFAGHIEGARKCAAEIERAFQPYDLVLTPATVAPPPRIGFNHMHTTELEAYHATLRDHGMAFSVPFNVSGQPACAIPIDIDELGLPVSAQIVGKWSDDATVLALAAEIERAAPWIDRRPPLWASDGIGGFARGGALDCALS